MNRELQLKQDILDELDFEPSIDAGNIHISVEDGIVHMTGDVPAFYQKNKAEEAVWRVAGVRGVVQNIDVNPESCALLDDEVIAHRILEHLRWRVLVPEESVQITVQNGVVVLHGEVQWNYQRSAAADVVNGIDGVRGLVNRITVVPQDRVGDIRQHIEKALHRQADIEAERIIVVEQDGIVTLTGKVHSWQERKAVNLAAWSAQGVTEVIDHLVMG